MYVCICNAITEKQVRQAAEAGVQDLWGLQAELGVGVACGSCKEMASDILRSHRNAATEEIAQPVLYTPSAA